ncbi:MAG: hypothetical protein HYS41_00040 [Candidatus Omnitrophica bacterium]|nr:hypothetical protein [Candidatus Omnitrophota bacterium]
MGNHQGAAMIVAVVTALVTTLIAAVVLEIGVQRLDLSVFRSGHARGNSASEAGLQYAFTRLDVDPNFRTAVQNDDDPPYVVTSLLAGNPLIDGNPVVPDERTNDLLMGSLTPTRTGKEVTSAITFDAGTGRYRVRAFSQDVP